MIRLCRVRIVNREPGSRIKIGLKNGKIIACLASPTADKLALLDDLVGIGPEDQVMDENIAVVQTMRILIDINGILDIIQKREPLQKKVRFLLCHPACIWYDEAITKKSRRLCGSRDVHWIW